jgi:hypothetical protein
VLAALARHRRQPVPMADFDLHGPVGCPARALLNQAVDFCSATSVVVDSTTASRRPCQLVASSLVWLQRRCELILSCWPAQQGTSAAAAVPYQHLGVSYAGVLPLWRRVVLASSRGLSRRRRTPPAPLGVSSAVVLFLCLASFFLLYPLVQSKRQIYALSSLFVCFCLGVHSYSRASTARSAPRTRTTRWWHPPALCVPLQEGQVSAPRLLCCIPRSCAFPNSPLYSGFRVFHVFRAPPPPPLPPPVPPSRVFRKKTLPAAQGEGVPGGLALDIDCLATRASEVIGFRAPYWLSMSDAAHAVKAMELPVRPAGVLRVSSRPS